MVPGDDGGGRRHDGGGGAAVRGALEPRRADAWVVRRVRTV